MRSPEWEYPLTTNDSRPARPPGTRASPIEQLKGRLRDPLELTEDHVLSILMVRRGREEVFGEGLFADPAWDVLLELFAAHLGKRTMSVAALAGSIGLPATTVARWVTALAEAGFAEHAGPGGEWVKLTQSGAAGMQRLAGHWGSAFLSI